MAFEVKVPQMGESVLEGTIVEWKVKEGDRVEVNTPLVEIMTDKVNVEIPSEVEGVIEKIKVEPGEVVQVGKIICTIATAGSPAKKADDKPTPKKEEKAPVPKKQAPAKAAKAPGGKAKMPPAVRKLVRDYGLDPAQINPTGPDGRITKEDVEKAAAARSGVAHIKTPSLPVSVPTPKPETAPQVSAASAKPVAKLPGLTETTFSPVEKQEEHQPLEGARKMISEHMRRSKDTSAHVTTFEDCDFTSLVEYRKARKDSFKATFGVNLTYMPFIAKAAVEALKEFPALNASMTEQEIIYKKSYNIGFAVARENGLIVPVVHNADQFSIIELALVMNDLGTRARNDQLKLEEVQGGTFTLTNAGMYGATASTPIINQPQVAILGIHNIAEKPVVKDGQIVIRHMSTLGMSFDHRLIDGHTAVQFLHRVIGYIEDPNLLLLRLR